MKKSIFTVWCESDILQHRSTTRNKTMALDYNTKYVFSWIIVPLSKQLKVLILHIFINNNWKCVLLGYKLLYTASNNKIEILSWCAHFSVVIHGPPGSLEADLIAKEEILLI
jgi:hypothetical protein